MSVSFMWEVVKPSKAKCFRYGTSSDMEPLKDTFGEFVTSEQMPVLRAMHRATQRDHSLWSDIADTLERLQGDDYESKVTLRIWPQF